MTSEIVLAFTPSNLMKDWQLESKDGDWFYEPIVRIHCLKHREAELCCGYWDHAIHQHPEPYYDKVAKRKVELPRLFLKHYPQKGEWEHFKTIDDVKQSPLYRKMRASTKLSKDLTS